MEGDAYAQITIFKVKSWLVGGKEDMKYRGTYALELGGLWSTHRKIFPVHMKFEVVHILKPYPQG